jgi:hypothetical protein
MSLAEFEEKVKQIPSLPCSVQAMGEASAPATYWPDDGLLAIASAALLRLSEETEDPAEAASALFFHHALSGEDRRFSDVLISDCTLTRIIARAMQSFKSADPMEAMSSDTLRSHLADLISYEPVMEINASDDEDCTDTPSSISQR